jgi:predicted  nucleic acid-binding Zn-ribbon protein
LKSSKTVQRSKLELINKETQTQNVNPDTRNNQKHDDTILKQQNNILNNEVQKLQMDLKIKEDLIESVNDAVVLKEAEIARLKTRIGLQERQINQQNFKESF